jgi:hypothetical protein
LCPAFRSVGLTRELAAAPARGSAEGRARSRSGGDIVGRVDVDAGRHHRHPDDADEAFIEGRAQWLGCCSRDTTESGCLLSLRVWGVTRISLRHPVHTMTGTFYEAAESSRLRGDGLVRWRGSFALDSFAWLVPPVLNACTRIAVEMCPARSILRAVGYELMAGRDVPDPATLPCRMNLNQIA